jgi:hypothetical protein
LNRYIVRSHNLPFLPLFPEKNHLSIEVLKTERNNENKKIFQRKNKNNAMEYLRIFLTAGKNIFSSLFLLNICNNIEIGDAIFSLARQSLKFLKMRFFINLC